MIDYSSVIKKIKPSIALIYALNAKGDPIGTGSGFVFIKRGILVTCNHVISGANSFLIRFPGAKQFIEGKVVIKDDEHGLALIKFNDDTKEPLNMGEIDKVTEGMPVIFSGYPLSSKELTSHQGIISAITKDATGIAAYIIDGTVNTGNSGCPLMDSEGRVIGIINAKRVFRGDILEKIESMKVGAVSLHGLDLVEIYQTLMGNFQLGIGFAIPASYIPDHKEIQDIKSELDANTNKQDG